MSLPFILLLVGILTVVGGIIWLRLHAFLALTLAALFVGVLTPSHLLQKHFIEEKGKSIKEAEVLAEKNIGSRLAEGFGRTSGKIGILIAMAAIIGTCLMESGGALRIVRSALSLLGEKKAPEALAGSSFLLGIPIFFDTLFYLMIPLAKALTAQTRKNYALYVMAIVAGGAMTHSLVPPTPGPLIVAGELGVDLGRMIVGGILVGLVGMTGAFIYARWFNRKYPIELRDNPNEKESKFIKLAKTPDDELPTLLSSLFPILIPVILLAGKSLLLPFSESLHENGLNGLLNLFTLLGDKNIALTLGALLALHQLMKSRLSSKTNLSESVKSSLQSAGVIILITGMGGAFGGILQQTSLGLDVAHFVSSQEFGPLAILMVAYFTTSVIRIAQGSGTVAMVTSIGIIGGLVEQGIDIHPVYLALAIGCGVKPIPWMNDSGFWVVGKLAGFTEGQTFKTFSIVIALQGVFGGIAVLALAYFFPQFIF